LVGRGNIPSVKVRDRVGGGSKSIKLEKNTKMGGQEEEYSSSRRAQLNDREHSDDAA
jgi:hypothetical protein